MSKHDQKHVLLTLPSKDGINCLTCENWDNIYCEYLGEGVCITTINPSDFYCREWEKAQEQENDNSN